MNNLFGIGILLELKDKVSQKLTALSRSLDDVQSEADETVRSMNKLDGVLKSGSSFELTSRESQALTNVLEGTSRTAYGFGRQMDRLSYYLGGEVSESTKTAYATMYALRSEVKKTSRQYGKYSMETMEARNRLHEFALSMDDNTFKQVYMRSELGLTGVQLQQQANSIKLNARMTKLMSSQTEILTRRMQGLQQAGVTPEMFMPPSTPGQFQILNETIKASHSPLYKLTGGYRSLGGSIETVLKKYSAQKVAIRMANGDMVRYGLLQRGITTGVANLGLAFPVMGAMAVAGYGALVGAVVEADEKLKSMIETVQGKLTKAFEPMLNIIKNVTQHVVKFVGKIADMMIAFNKAHPLCAKVVQGFALLLPALTVLLLPLGMIPIGLNAFAVALNNLWTLIGPFVAGIGTASAMALGLVAVIGTLTLVLTNLWKSNQKFRDTVKQVWKDVSSYISQVCELIASNFAKIQEVLAPLGQALFDFLTNVFSIGFEILTAIFSNGTKDFKTAWDNGFSAIMTKTTEVLNKITSWITEKLTLATEIVKQATEKMKEWWKVHGDAVVQAVVQGYNRVKDTVKTVLDTVISVVKSVLDTMINFWKDNSGTIISIISSMVSTVGSVLSSMMSVVKSILDIIKKFWDEHGQSILSTVTEIYGLILGIIQAVAPIVQSVFNGIASFLQTHGDTISTIFSVAWTFISGFITGILNNIKGVIEGVLNTIDGIISLFSAISQGKFKQMWEAIKQIFTGAVQAIYNGVMLFFSVQFLGSLKTMWTGAVGLVKGMWTGIKSGFSTGVTACYVWIDDLVKGVINWFTNLGTSAPALINNMWNFVKNAFKSGCSGIVSLVQGFISSVLNFFRSLASGSTTIFSALWNTGRSLWNAGVSALKGLISSLVSAVKSRLSSMVSSARSLFSNLVSAGRTQFNNLLSTVVRTVSQIPGKIRSFMSQAISYLKGISLMSIGKNMIQGLVNGITSMAGRVRDAVKKVADGAKQKIQGVLGIHSPSRVFQEIGRFTSQGMAIGVTDNAPLVNKSIEDIGRSAVKQADTIIKHDFVFNQEPMQPLKQDLIMERKPLVEDSVISPVVQPRIQQEQLVGQDLNVNPVVQSLGEQDLKVKPIVEPLEEQDLKVTPVIEPLMEQDLKVNPIVENDLRIKPILEPIGEQNVTVNPVVEPMVEQELTVKPIVEALKEQFLKVKPLIEPIGEQDVKFNSIVEPLLDQELKVKPIIEPLEEQELKVKPLQQQELDVNTNINDINKVKDNNKVNETMTSIGNKPQVQPVESNPNTNVTNNFTIQMDVKGTESPRELVDQIMKELQRRTQLRNVLAYR